MYLIIERHRYDTIPHSYYVKKTSNSYEDALKYKKAYQDLNTDKNVEYQISAYVDKLEREVA
jgi:hypothetical protein